MERKYLLFSIHKEKDSSDPEILRSEAESHSTIQSLYMVWVNHLKSNSGVSSFSVIISDPDGAVLDREDHNFKELKEWGNKTLLGLSMEILFQFKQPDTIN